MIETGRVTAQGGLHLRAEPSVNSEIVATLPRDAIVQIDGRDGNWLRVEYQFKRGYLYKSYVDVLSIPEWAGRPARPCLDTCSERDGTVLIPEPPPVKRYLAAIWTLVAVIVAAFIAFVYGVLGWHP